MNINNILKKIGKKINIKGLSKEVCDLYSLDEYKSYKVINVGADDFSYYLRTKSKKYVVKILNKRKDIEDIRKFEDTYKIFMHNEIKCPNLLKNIYGKYLSRLQFDGINITLCLIEYINGRDLYSAHKKITKQDIDKIVNLLVSIHNIKDIYEIEYDQYSCMKLNKVIEENKNKIPKNLLNDVHSFLKEYNNVDFDRLSTCYIHADLACSNIIKDKENELFAIDFIQSGTGIRLLDIVIVINRCIFNYKNIKYSKKMERYFLEKYQEKIKLTEYELEVLPILEKANAYSFAILEYANLGSKKSYKNDMKFIENITPLIKK